MAQLALLSALGLRHELLSGWTERFVALRLLPEFVRQWQASRDGNVDAWSTEKFTTEIRAQPLDIVSQVSQSVSDMSEFALDHSHPPWGFFLHCAKDSLNVAIEAPLAVEIVDTGDE